MRTMFRYEMLAKISNSPSWRKGNLNYQTGLASLNHKERKKHEQNCTQPSITEVIRLRMSKTQNFNNNPKYLYQLKHFEIILGDYMTKQFREGSIAWHVVTILKENDNKPMHYNDILRRLMKRKKLIGSTKSATLLSILLRNNSTFIKTKRGWYKLQ